MLRTLRRCFSLPWSLAAVERYKCKQCCGFCPNRILHLFALSECNMNPQWAHQSVQTRPDQKGPDQTRPHHKTPHHTRLDNRLVTTLDQTKLDQATPDHITKRQSFPSWPPWPLWPTWSLWPFWLIKWIIKKLNAESASVVLSLKYCVCKTKWHGCLQN